MVIILGNYFLQMLESLILVLEIEWELTVRFYVRFVCNTVFGTLYNVLQQLRVHIFSTQCH